MDEHTLQCGLSKRLGTEDMESEKNTIVNTFTYPMMASTEINVDILAIE